MFLHLTFQSHHKYHASLIHRTTSIHRNQNMTTDSNNEINQLLEFTAAELKGKIRPAEVVVDQNTVRGWIGCWRLSL